MIVLNNGGYGTERPMLDGAFNDVLLWQYSQLPKLLGTGRGFDIWTEDDLEAALKDCRSHTDSFCILDVHLDAKDSSIAMQRLTNALGKRINS